MSVHSVAMQTYQREIQRWTEVKESQPQFAEMAEKEIIHFQERYLRSQKLEEQLCAAKKCLEESLEKCSVKEQAVPTSTTVQPAQCAEASDSKMPCYKPLQRFVGVSGKAGFVKKGERIPLDLSQVEEITTVPCRQCIGCRTRKKLDWSLRMCHELQARQGRGAFLTLTYDEDHVPSDMGLVKKDLQDFNKRLRKKLSPLTYKYFACGEYGDKYLRPHYHMAIFGYDFPDKQKTRRVKGNDYFRSELLDKAWGKGMCVIGNLTRESAAYVAKYCQKKVTGDAAKDHYYRHDSETGEAWNVSPEFQLSSRNPAIGRLWFENYLHDVFPSDEVVFAGKKYPVPQYYTDLLQKLNPELHDQVKQNREDDRDYKAAELSLDRLAAIEKCKLLEMKKKMLDSIL